MRFLSTIRDTIIGRTEPFGIDVSPEMQSALQVRGQFDPERVLPWQANRSANWTGIEGNQRLIDTARKSVVVYACLTYLADAVAESPLKVYRTVKGEKVEQPDHRARQILQNPNPYMSEAEFMALLVIGMGMQGYAVVEKVRSSGGLPVELWPLRPDWLLKRLQPNGQKTREYTYRSPGIPERTIPEQDIIIIPYRHDDRMEAPGVTPLQIAAREIGIDSSLTEFLKVFLDSGGIPPFALEYPDPISDQAIIDQMQAAWGQKYGGSQAYGKLPVFHGGYKIIKVGDGINDMAWPDLRSITEDKICQAFRVPRELVQTHSTAAGGSGLTTTEQEGAMLSLQRYGATPLRNRIDGAFTRGFLTEFTGNDAAYDIGFDVSEVLALQEDRDKLHTRARADYDAAAITLNQYLQETGRQPLGPGGDVYKVPFSVVFTKLPDLAAPSITTQPAKAIGSGPETNRFTGKRVVIDSRGTRVYRDIKSLSGPEIELRSKITQQNRKEQQRLSEILNRKMVGFFREQGKRIAAAARKSADAYERRDVTDVATIDWDAELEELSKIMDRFYQTAGEAAATNATATLGVDVAWDLSNPNISRTMKQLGSRIADINATTRDDVARIVTDSMRDGMTLEETAARLTGQFEETYRGRAMTIARTESQVSYNTASLVSYQESGVVSEAELLDNPDHTDSYDATDGLTCAERNGLVVPLTDVPIHIDAEHPNGSLAVLPVVTLGE